MCQIIIKEKKTYGEINLICLIWTYEKRVCGTKSKFIYLFFFYKFAGI